LTNSPAWTSGVKPLSGGYEGGGALQFDGVDDYVLVPWDLSINPTDEITIEFWVKTSDAVRLSYKYGWSSAEAGNVVPICISGNHWGIYSQHNDPTWMWSSFTAINDDKWHHLTITYDKSLASGNMKSYVDGELSGTPKTFTTGIPIGDASHVLRMGTYFAAIPATFSKEMMDEVRIYNRALSAKEVRYHYNRSGPVAHWKFDEGSGTTTYDRTNNNNDGTFVNDATSPGWVSGKYGSALLFDGENDYVDCGSDSSLDITGDITIEAWVKPNTISGGDHIVSKEIDSSGTGVDDSYAFYLYNGTLKIRIRHTNLSETNLGSTNAVSAGVFSHVVVTYDGGTTNAVKYYINGNLDTTQSVGSTGINVSTTKLLIGANLKPNTSTPANFFNGTIDDARIYNYVRTPEQIRQDYNGGVGTHF